MKPHHINQQNNFIGGWYHNDIALCDDIIQFHKESPSVSKNPGYTYKGDVCTVDFDVKNSVDVVLHKNRDLMQRYLDYLQESIDEYINLYPECAKGAHWCVREDVNVQYYKPGGGYLRWHCERSGPGSTLRHLVFMTYLTTHNDPDESRNLGGTAFKYQNLNMKAEKGLTLIWPSDWTHTHKSIICPDKEKYIVTGWLSYKG